LITAVLPDEILKIKEISKAKVEIKIWEVDAYFGTPR